MHKTPYDTRGNARAYLPYRGYYATSGHYLPFSSAYDTTLGGKKKNDFAQQFYLFCAGYFALLGSMHGPVLTHCHAIDFLEKYAYIRREIVA